MAEIVITSKVDFMGEFEPSMTEFQEMKIFPKIDKGKLLEFRNQTVDWVLLDGETVKPAALQDFRTLFKDSKIFYIRHLIRSEKQEKALSSQAKMYNIQLIQEDLTPRQIAHVMKSELFDSLLKTNKRMFTFFGTHSGSGVTTTAYNTAKRLADRLKGDVILLSLDSYDSGDYLFIPNGRSLDDLKSELQYGDLTEEDLKNAADKHTSNFYHLIGNTDLKLQGYFTGKEIDTLFEVASKSFDAIIVDAGSHFDNAAVTQAYIQSGTKFLISTQEPKGYRGKFPKVLQQIIEPIGGDASDFHLIVNKYQTNSTLPKDNDIETDTGAIKLTTIPHEGVEMIKTTTSHGFHVDVGSGSYRDSLEDITNFIASEADLPLGDTKNKKRKGLFG